MFPLIQICSTILLVMMVVGLLLYVSRIPQAATLLEGESLEANARARAFLLRVAKITGAQQSGIAYNLKTKDARFLVNSYYVQRLTKNVAGGVCFEQTCYYIPDFRIPAPERIATVLLQLRSNPSLFDQWAGRSGCYKADGTRFQRQ